VLNTTATESYRMLSEVHGEEFLSRDAFFPDCRNYDTLALNPMNRIAKETNTDKIIILLRSPF